MSDIDKEIKEALSAAKPKKGKSTSQTINIEAQNVSVNTGEGDQKVSISGEKEEQRKVPKPLPDDVKFEGAPIKGEVVEPKKKPKNLLEDIAKDPMKFYKPPKEGRKLDLQNKKSKTKPEFIDEGEGSIGEFLSKVTDDEIKDESDERRFRPAPIVEDMAVRDGERKSDKKEREAFMRANVFVISFVAFWVVLSLLYTYGVFG